MTWIFFGIYALMVLTSQVSDSISIGGGSGNTHRNAPLAVENVYGILSWIGIIMSTAFFNATATRDYTYGMDQIVFALPIKKSHFFFGKFFGAAVIALIPYLGITLGMLIAPYWPGVDPLRYGAFVPQAHLYGFLLFGVFNTLFGGALIYSFAIYFRNPVVSYLSAFGIVILYIISLSLISDVENEWIAVFTDPFGIKVLNIYTKYWTPAQNNTNYVKLEAIVLTNRLFWTGISLSVLLLLYRLFDFTRPKVSARAEGKTVSLGKVYEQVPQLVISHRPVAAWWSQFVFELKSIVRNNAFIILMSIGVVNLIVGLSMNTGFYGNKSLPVTYSVVDDISNSLSIFIYAFIIFYTGYTIFRERDAKINEIIDATPVKSATVITSKVFAIIAALSIVYLGSIAIGMIYQLMNGYTNLEPGVYLTLFGIRLLNASFIIVAGCLLQILINNKYLAYFAVVVFLICNSFLWQALKVESNMVVFGGMPGIIYSDMNGFGPYIPGTINFSLYWTVVCSLIVLVMAGMYLRGKEISFKTRLANLRVYLKQNKGLVALLFVLFIADAAWLFYNTKVLNTYRSSKEEELLQVSYERKYKKYEKMDLPYTTSIAYKIDVFPSKRDMHTEARWWIKNVHPRPVTELHYNMPELAKHINFIIPGAKLVMEDKELHYNIYKLDKPLQPNDSIQLSYTADFINNGIENEVTNNELTQNGSFFHDGDFMPHLGYFSGGELRDKNDRRKYKLAPKSRSAKLTRDCGEVCNASYISNNAAWVDITTTISTDAGQMAIAPGSLVKEWKENNRNYYTYQLKHQSLNFFSFISANYEVKKDTVNGINIEVYYYKHHPYNVDRMVKAVKNSLKYYTENFGPYYHEQCRIIEFPRYQTFAQAFPGTMPYSEGIGYITDLRDPKSIDMVTYVVAHEMGHQWWAHQVIGPKMQGSEMFSEGLAQYSALMVMENMYGKQHINRFLKYEMDKYLRNRAGETEYENPVLRSEGQGYIHYQKAGIVYYYLKEMIGVQKMNEALRTIVNKYAYKQPPFPTAYNVLDELKAVTPDSLQYLFTDMFETITLFNNRVEKVSVTPAKDKQYNVQMTVLSEKVRSDSLGNEKPIAVNDYIDIGLFGKNDGNELGKPILYQRVKVNQQHTTLNFTVAEKPYQVGIDPYHYLIDKVISDNLKKVN